MRHDAAATVLSIPGVRYGAKASRLRDTPNRGPSRPSNPENLEVKGAYMDWTIGTVAHWAGVHVETVRYYERIGLLSRPARVAGRVRRYSTEALERVRFIKRAQWLGFSLDEIAKLLSLTKLALLRRKRDELSAIQATLEDLLSE